VDGVGSFDVAAGASLFAKPQLIGMGPSQSATAYNSRSLRFRDVTINLATPQRVSLRIKNMEMKA
jgi:hypothetical protein